MGGSSKSKTTNNTTTETLNANVQGNEGMVVSGKGNSLNVTDGGAIQRMADITMAGLNLQEKANAKAMTFAEGASRNALEFAHDAGRPDSATAQTLGKYALLTAGGLAAAYVLAGRK